MSIWPSRLCKSLIPPPLDYWIVLNAQLSIVVSVLSLSAECCVLSRPSLSALSLGTLSLGRPLSLGAPSSASCVALRNRNWWILLIVVFVVFPSLSLSLSLPLSERWVLFRPSSLYISQLFIIVDCCFFFLSQRRVLRSLSRPPTPSLSDEAASAIAIDSYLRQTFIGSKYNLLFLQLVYYFVWKTQSHQK